MKRLIKKGVAPLNLRLDAELKGKIGQIQDLYMATMNKPGFSLGPVKGITQAHIIRWALEEGLASIEARLSKHGKQS